MDERKASATNVAVNTSDPNQRAKESDVDVLLKLKKMLDAGLIEHSEYDAKKREVLERM